MRKFTLALLLTAFSFGLKAETTQIQYLSGTDSDDAVLWDFYCTEGRNSGEWAKIPVPSCWELQGFGTFQYGMPFYGKANPPGIAKEQGLYKYSFNLPKGWEGKIVRLVFDGVMTDCSAQINGRRAVKLHQGAFYRFKADVSDRVFFGDTANVLEVTVNKESSNKNVNLAERRGDYWNFGGIFRPVYMEALPPQFIDRVGIDARADGSFLAEVFLGSAPAEGYSVEAKLVDKDGKVVGQPLFTPVRGGGDKVTLEGNFSNIRTWTAETPNLYNVELRLLKDGKEVHLVRERIGFRTIEVREGEGLFINGQRIMVKGVNRHSFRPEKGRTLSKKDNYDDVKLIKEMNMNSVRSSHYPPDVSFLKACDELGLYVMDELSGWHGKHDTEVGRQLVQEMVTRDANVPSIIWWANGNEKGWNTELDGEFHRWDIQKRPVLHPQGNFSGFETMHYRSYGESQEYMRLPELFMPTEFLHALYDGGAGAGLKDYWDMFKDHPRAVGGFIWLFADEGVVRVDQNNRIDNVGNYGADGIVGPHHEKEGSFYTVREVWSPIQIEEKELPKNFQGRLTVENCYDFTFLDKCNFKWKLVKFATPEDGKTGHTVLSEGNFNGPAIAPHGKGTLSVNLPANRNSADALMLTAYGPDRNSIWTWSWPLASYKMKEEKASSGSVQIREKKDVCIVKAGKVEYNFNMKTGELMEVNAGKKFAFGNGPRFVAFRRGDRSMDVFYNHDDDKARSKERVYNDVSGISRLKSFTSEKKGDSVVITVEYDRSNLIKSVWTILSNGLAKLDYEYRYDGVVELMGIKFDYPESRMLSKRWLGDGPYRVWQNRLQGPTLDVWETKYNDPIPGESFIYPEFKGYFSNWSWVDFRTTDGNFRMYNGTPNSYLGVYSPRDGRDVILYTFPDGGIAVLDVIPAVRNKVNTTD
ncbi:MAG: hypothetical protein LBH34_05890, partial [Prevotellaceae bacterium]|nr:hypothetical protein [Prevotellaceae bacterium]